jgi:hypothetical protein
MVAERKIAEFAIGKPDEDGTTDSVEECTLCMLYYSTGLNSCQQCHQGMCSDCFANLIDPTPKNSKCPFCDHGPFEIHFKGRKSTEELAAIREEEEKMKRIERAQLDAAIRAEEERMARKGRGESPSATPVTGIMDGVRERFDGTPAKVPDAAPLTADELAELPDEIRRAIEEEELRQRLVAFYRFRNPGKIKEVPKIVRTYGTHRKTELMAAMVARYGAEPSGEVAFSDVVDRLVFYYATKSRERMSREGIERMVRRFAGSEWRAMAAVVLESGPEPDPLAVPLPVGSTQPDSAIATSDDLGLSPQRSRAPSAAVPASGAGSPSNHQQLPQGGARAGVSPGISPSVSPSRSPARSPQPAPHDNRRLTDVTAQFKAETMRQRVVSILRFNRPDLLGHIDNVLAQYGERDPTSIIGHTTLTEASIRAIATRIGPEPSGTELREDTVNRVKNFYSKQVGQQRHDVETMVERFRGKEYELMAGLIVKYGAEPPGAPLPSNRRFEDSNEPPAGMGIPTHLKAAAPIALAQPDPDGVDDEELAVALRMSQEMARTQEGRA